MLIPLLLSASFWQLAAQCLFENEDALMECAAAGCLAKSTVGGGSSCLGACLGTAGVQRSCAECLGEGVACAVKSCESSCYPGRENFYAAQCGRCLQQHRCRTCTDQGTIDGSTKSVSSGDVPGAVYAQLADLASKTGAWEAARAQGFCFEDQIKLKKCGTECAEASSRSPRAQCVTRCLRREGMQFGCASCFGDKVDCTMKNCLDNCVTSANGLSCRRCVQQKCGTCHQAKDMDPDTFYGAVLHAAIAYRNRRNQTEIFP